MKIATPADANEIADFIRTSERRYVAALQEVKDMISRAKKATPELACIYSIYSRGEKQFGNELKHPRKIRLSINQHCQRTGAGEYDIFSMPDIVGTTVAVSFPSDINTVNAILDKWVDERMLFPVYFDKDNVNKNANRKIKTVYGNIKSEEGYHACHYYFRVKNMEWEPIVEVQIKTLLHDAWGLLTHDLTYKPPVKLGNELAQHFSLLGDQLSRLCSFSM